MENIFNENANAKPKYLDHLYCHTNETKTVMRSNHKYNNNVNKTMNAADAEIVLKENKQLKSMLLLHLDLIQQQAEDLSVKEAELMTRTEECDKLRAFNAQLEAKVVDLQRQLQRQIKRTVVKRTFLPPPPLAKIQCHNESITNMTFPAKIVRVSSNDSATATTTITNAKLNSSTVNSLTKCKTAIAATINAPVATTSKLLPALEKIEIKHEQTLNASKNEAQHNCELYDEDVAEKQTITIKVEKTLEEKQHVKDIEIKNALVQSTAESKKHAESEIAVKVETELKLNAKLKHVNETNFFSNIHSSTTCSSPCSSNTLRTSMTSSSTNSSKRRRLWQASDFETDEDSMSSYDSLLDIETNSNTCASPLPTESCDSSTDCCEETDCSMSSSCSSKSSIATASDAGSSKHNFMYHIVTSPYLSRPWQEEELDGELEEDEAEALRAAEPKLEIPKWTEHEITPLYSIEGTEDLTDDTFSKRHSKLELDEKRRKKWDVQQIREQRRIEKLRRRHCKDELAQGPIIQSFFPLAEELETICFVETLQVQAFGEPIPKLSNNGEGFRLPWIVETPGRTVRICKKLQKDEIASKNENDIEIENLEFNENMENENETKYENKEEKEELVENRTIKAKDEDKDSTKEENVLENMQINYNNESNDETKHNNVNTEDEQQEKCSNTIIREAISLDDDDNSNSSNIDDSCDNNSKMDDSPFRFAAIAGSCYHSPVIMLAKHSKPCASRTQMRKRLRYSSFLFLTKRRRQLSMSTIAQATNNAQITVSTANNSIAAENSNINTVITTSPTTTVALCTAPITTTEIATTNTTTITATTTTTATNIIGKIENKLNEQKATIAIKTRSMQPSTRKITRALVTAQNKPIAAVIEKNSLEIATPTTDSSSITKATGLVKSTVSTNVNITSTTTVSSVAPITAAAVVKPTTRSFEKRTIDDKNISKSLTSTIETTTTTATMIAATTNATRSKLRAFRVATPTSSTNNINTNCATITTSLASNEEKTKSK